MLKKMRWRMIFSAMTAFFAVMLILVTLINVVNYNAVTKRADNNLSEILKFEDTRKNAPPRGGVPFPDFPNFPGPPEQELEYTTRFFTVNVDDQGKILSVSTDYVSSVDESEAGQYARKVLEKRKESGYMDVYRFAVKKTDSGNVIAFLNTAKEQESMHTLLKLSVMIAVSGLILVFILIVLLSKRVMKPFVRNMEQQKRFITDAGHELKTPLTSISTSADVLEMEQGKNEWISNIKSQTERMSKMVGELVTLSRLDEASPIPNKEKFSLSDTAWETAEAFKSLAKAQNKTFDINIEDNVCMTGDVAEIRQMLSVILDNAVRYSSGEGDIRFNVEKRKNKIYIEVFNLCDFEEPPDVNRLFDRFYRPDESRNRNTGGTGVGLAIAKAVAESHGGEISAFCPDGKSMTVKVVI